MTVALTESASIVWRFLDTIDADIPERDERLESTIMISISPVQLLFKGKFWVETQAWRRKVTA